MDQEAFETKIQSMPEELKDTFREQLNLQLSKRIVNRFMSVVLQAYAQGQRAYAQGQRAYAQEQQNAQKDERYSSGYADGSNDMREAIQSILRIPGKDLKKLFGADLDITNYTPIYILTKIIGMDSNTIYSKLAIYNMDKMYDDANREAEEAVRTLADKIGIHKLYAVVRELRGEGEQGDDLPL